jgi:methyl-accepting chemotaxis protein
MKMFGYITFKIRILLGFGVILTMMTAMALFNYFNGVKSKNSLAAIDNVILPNAVTASDMTTAIVQVQQFLTDVSATHNTGGFDEAERYARSFKDGLKKLRQASKDDAGQLRLLTELEHDFDRFYADGKRMSATYLNNGMEAGNLIMAEFDKSSVSLTTRMEAFREAEVKQATAHVHELTETARTVSHILLALPW